MKAPQKSKLRVVDPLKGWTLADVVLVVLSLAFFFCSLLAYDRWWQWKHGLVGIDSPALWTLLAALILTIAPNRPKVIAGASGVCIFYGLKGVLMEQEPWAWLFIIGPLIIVVAVALLFPASILREQKK